MRVILAERGQVTIPKRIRSELGIKAGSVLEISLENGAIYIEKVSQQDPFEEVFGCLKKTINTDEFINEIRGKL